MRNKNIFILLVILLLGTSLVMSGCQGNVISNFDVLSALFRCLLYGECSDYYYSESIQKVSLTYVGSSEPESVVGEWRAEEKSGQDYFLLHLNPDRTVQLERRSIQSEEVVASTHGRYEMTDVYLMFTMENGARMAVLYKRDGSSLELYPQSP